MDFQWQVTETKLRQTMHKREFLDPLTEKPKRNLVPGLSVYPRLLSMVGPIVYYQPGLVLGKE